MSLVFGSKVHRIAHAFAHRYVAGPFDDQTDPRMRGLCIYRTSIDEARRLAQDDPAVKAGRLEVEVLSWWVEKGAMTFPIGDDMARGKK